MGTINVNVKVSETVNIDLEVSEIIDAINENNCLSRWSLIGKILNGVEAHISKLTPEQKEIIKDFLSKKLQLFND